MPEPTNEKRSEPLSEREVAIRVEVERRAGHGADDEQWDAIEAQVRAEFDQQPPIRPMAPLQIAIRRAHGWLSTDGWHEREAYRLAERNPDE